MTLLWSWAQSNQVLFLCLSIFGIYLGRELFLYQLRRYQYIYYLFLFPGVVFHEMAHIVGCLISGARIKSILLFSKTGGEVVHEKPAIPYIGIFLISIFPFITGSVAIYLITSRALNDITFSNLTVDKAIYFYLLISILISMFPSSTDVKNARFAYLVFIFVLALVLSKTSLTAIFPILYKTVLFCAAVLIVVNIIIAAFNQTRKK
jgi:hypothetical protein